MDAAPPKFVDAARARPLSPGTHSRAWRACGLTNPYSETPPTPANSLPGQAQRPRRNLSLGKIPVAGVYPALSVPTQAP